MKSYFSLLVATTLLVSNTAAAQTGLNRGPQTPTQRINQGQQVASSVSASVPQDALQQAAAQRRGQFGSMSRTTVPLGQIQKAWDKAGNKSGVHTQVECGTCVYRVRLREFMLTVIQLPEGVKIENADVADVSLFDTQVRNDNTLVIKPLAAGVDSSLQVYAEDGQVYSFYLRAETVNSKHIPDLRFKIEKPHYTRSALIGVAAGGAPSPLMNMTYPAQVPATEPVPGDYVKKANIDPSKLRGWGDYKLWGSDDSLKPEMVLRDDHFTYIFYGDKFNSLELPTAYVVVDGIDELVNTRRSGSTYIVESTNKLVTLKSGQSFMCIEYKGS
ncbi:TrbG/VirB9 family P-type conjugative transfer protein [Pseudovibrio sp. Tun.PSC04-5.I4]|uniref:TrbG/VirB9 family P-type conjugative transfer protein n=1 Tax=Pseudovibrio sp. Tun.PSC04-5.I4 TaxID=1798213 RepID=UPI00087ED653|nr:TrbG/VirB9 family P-type conjugative transfer protein [Pseudovibrio sp. Tun.PSC04-5.I4]SDR45112.1 ComB9 competence protein [Pseudovibrio sp. Tun.PSC04-5.I4]